MNILYVSAQRQSTFANFLHQSAHNSIKQTYTGISPYYSTETELYWFS